MKNKIFIKNSIFFVLASFSIANGYFIKAAEGEGAGNLFLSKLPAELSVQILGKVVQTWPHQDDIKDGHISQKNRIATIWLALNTALAYYFADNSLGQHTIEILRKIASNPSLVDSINEFQRCIHLLTAFYEKNLNNGNLRIQPEVALQKLAAIMQYISDHKDDFEQLIAEQLQNHKKLIELTSKEMLTEEDIRNLQDLLDKGVALNYIAQYTDQQSTRTGSSPIPTESAAGVAEDEYAGHLALVNATNKQQTEVVKSLLKYGAFTNLKEKKYGNTALHMAVYRNRRDLVDLLLQYDATQSANKKGQYPIQYAPYHFVGTEVLEPLVQQPMPVLPTSMLTETANSPEKLNLLLLHTDPINIDASTPRGHTPLIAAAELGNDRSVEIILKSAQRSASPVPLLSTDKALEIAKQRAQRTTRHERRRSYDRIVQLLSKETKRT